MRGKWILGCCLLLGACGLGPAMFRGDVIAFGDVIEETTNKMLMLNLLRARDKAPLHFADIATMRETVQQSASLGFLQLFGPARGTQRETGTYGASVQVSPSVEFNHLLSKEFHTGIASPIDPKIVKYWLDRGLDRRIVLMLFFSAAEIVETVSASGPVHTIRISNSPRQAIDVIRQRDFRMERQEALRCDLQSDFERYLKLLNTLDTFFINTYRERRLISRGIRLDSDRNLKELLSIDPNKIQLQPGRDGVTNDLYLISPESKVAFCFYDAARRTNPGGGFEFITSGAAPAGSKRHCFQGVVDAGADEAKSELHEMPLSFAGPRRVNSPSSYCSAYNGFVGIESPPSDAEYPRRELRLRIRSVGEIFQFLGDLLYYQEEVQRMKDEHPDRDIRLNTPVTFGYCSDHPEAGCDDVYLRLSENSCNSRVSVSYRNRSYHVADLNGSARDATCAPSSPRGVDHSLELLSVLHHLVGLHRSATDIRSSPFVQVLP